ncbi:hypothetical protein G7Z17_g2663 [Cylindrodendrum hubeiense]|uniref:Uncharacterized protein n=1 Tax=Cylindrodendrum hubeiense TaxID=595255 RepID=A0A9P5HKF2_9HYPO|nr:hypothetical protein G7Z17_g2663 [Cylindrodendrum hubeiense]
MTTHFTFLNTSNAPRLGASDTKRMRAHVTKSNFAQRRQRLAKERHLKVSHDTRQEPADDAEQAITRRPVVPAHFSAAGRKLDQQLPTFSIDIDSSLKFLLHEFRPIIFPAGNGSPGSVCPGSANEEQWIRLFMSEPALLEASMAIAFRTAPGHQSASNSRRADLHAFRAVSIVNQRLSTTSTMLTDGVLAAVFTLALSERLAHNEAAWNVHVDGLSQMIKLRRSSGNDDFPVCDSLSEMIASPKTPPKKIIDALSAPGGVTGLDISRISRDMDMLSKALDVFYTRPEDAEFLGQKIGERVNRLHREIDRLLTNDGTYIRSWAGALRIFVHLSWPPKPDVDLGDLALALKGMLETPGIRLCSSIDMTVWQFFIGAVAAEGSNIRLWFIARVRRMFKPMHRPIMDPLQKWRRSPTPTLRPSEPVTAAARHRLGVLFDPPSPAASRCPRLMLRCRVLVDNADAPFSTLMRHQGVSRDITTNTSTCEYTSTCESTIKLNPLKGASRHSATMSSQGQGQGSGASPPTQTISGPPYLITTVATLGGNPEPSVDDPILGVLIALLLASAVFNMTIYRRNAKRNYKFLFSALLFGFSVARTVACVLRIVVGSKPTEVGTRIASQVLMNAGVILLFVINILFAQRILRAYHPKFGWSKPVRLVFRALFVTIGAVLVMMIIVMIYSFYTLDASVRSTIRTLQLFSATYFAVLAILPVLITVPTILLPREGPIENFGQGSMRTKVRLVIFTSLLLTLGAGFRAGIAYYVRPATNPAWFHHKACFYLFNFGIEITVVYLYALIRFDRRFYIPNGSSGPGDYSQMQEMDIALDASSERRDNRSEDTILNKDETTPTAAGVKLEDKHEPV